MAFQVVGVIPEDKVPQMDLEGVPNEKKGKQYYTGHFQVGMRRDFMEIHETSRKGLCK